MAKVQLIVYVKLSQAQTEKPKYVASDLWQFFQGYLLSDIVSIIMTAQLCSSRFLEAFHSEYVSMHAQLSNFYRLLPSLLLHTQIASKIQTRYTGFSILCISCQALLCLYIHFGGWGGGVKEVQLYSLGSILLQGINEESFFCEKGCMGWNGWPPKEINEHAYRLHQYCVGWFSLMIIGQRCELLQYTFIVVK